MAMEPDDVSRTLIPIHLPHHAPNTARRRQQNLRRVRSAAVAMTIFYRGAARYARLRAEQRLGFWPKSARRFAGFAAEANGAKIISGVRIMLGLFVADDRHAIRLDVELSLQRNAVGAVRECVFHVARVARCLH